MNQKGFATIFGLCLMLAFVLVVKGVQESELNDAHEIKDFQTEFNLQNAADVGIYMAAAKVEKNPELLPVNPNPYLNNHVDYRRELISEKIESISVKVWGERIGVYHFRELYPSYDKEEKGATSDVYILFSRAEIENERIGGKSYRRAFAYVSAGTIHFME